MNAPILVGFCPDTADHGPVNFAVAASRFTGAPLVVVAVRPGGSRVERFAAGEFHGADPDAAAAALERLRAGLSEQGAEATIDVTEHPSAARGLAAAVEERAPRLLVLGSSRRGGVRRVLPGSTAERLLHGSTCPVVVVPQGHEIPEQGMRVVGAAFTDTPEGHSALRAGALLARAAGAKLQVVAVFDPAHAEEQSPGLMVRQHGAERRDEERRARERLTGRDMVDAAIEEVADGITVEPDVLFNDPVDGLVAASGVLDLLVMGSRGYGPMHGVLLGGVSRRVIAEAKCPTLVLPRGTGDEVEALVAQRGADAAP